MFGNPETTTGGNALKFYSSVRLDIRRIGAVTQGEDVLGSQVRVKVVKNKVAPPFKKAEFDILYGEGISKEGDLIELGTTAGIVQKTGAWYSYGDERLGQGKENARTFLKENPDIYEKIRDQVFTTFGVRKPAGQNAAAAEAAGRDGGAPGAERETSAREAVARDRAGPAEPTARGGRGRGRAGTAAG